MALVAAAAYRRRSFQGHGTDAWGAIYIAGRQLGSDVALEAGAAYRRHSFQGHGTDAWGATYIEGSQLGSDVTLEVAGATFAAAASKVTALTHWEPPWGADGYSGQQAGRVGTAE